MFLYLFFGFSSIFPDAPLSFSASTDPESFPIVPIRHDGHPRGL